MAELEEQAMEAQEDVQKGCFGVLSVAFGYLMVGTTIILLSILIFWQ